MIRLVRSARMQHRLRLEVLLSADGEELLEQQGVPGVGLEDGSSYVSGKGDHADPEGDHVVGGHLGEEPRWEIAFLAGADDEDLVEEETGDVSGDLGTSRKIRSAGEIDD